MMHGYPPHDRTGGAGTATPPQYQPHPGAGQLGDLGSAHRDPPGRTAGRPADTRAPVTASIRAAPPLAQSSPSGLPRASDPEKAEEPMDRDLPECELPPAQQYTLDFPNLTALRRRQQDAGTELRRFYAANEGEPKAEDAETLEPGGTTYLASAQAQSAAPCDDPSGGAANAGT